MIYDFMLSSLAGSSAFCRFLKLAKML